MRAMVRIYTKKGDDGTTASSTGAGSQGLRRRCELNGAVDEAQAAMGMARAEAEPGSELDTLLVGLERDLYVLMAEVATDPAKRSKLAAGSTLVTGEMVGALEAASTGSLARFEMPAEFVVPGGQPGLRRPRRGPHGGAPGRAAGGGVGGRGLARAAPTSTGCPTCCGPWPAGRRARSTSWPARRRGAGTGRREDIGTGVNGGKSS